jgi:hypothetical protein
MTAPHAVLKKFPPPGKPKSPGLAAVEIRDLSKHFGPATTVRVTTSSGTSIHTQVRLTGGLPVRFARRGAPAPGEPVPSPASTSTAGRTARTRLNVDDAWCEALFASALQRSAAPAAESVAAAISRAVRRFGTRGCISRMAQEFGDHPQAAAERMRWVRQLAAEAAAPVTREPGPEAARVAGSPATTADQRNQHGRNETQ